MKRVVIVRHAKAVPYGYDDDFNRKLRKKGKDDARLISSTLREDRVKPDMIISSPAKRAYKTAKIYAKTLRYPKEKIVLEEELYDGLSIQDFIEMLRDLPEEVKTVFVFGHNPTVYFLVNNLVRFFNKDVPTCSTVAIDFKTTSWKEISSRNGALAFQLVPRMFR